MHKKILMEKKRNVEMLIATVNKSIKCKRGEIEMSQKEKFAGFNFENNKYEQEARERWGDEAVNDANQKLKQMTKDEKQVMGEQFEQIYKNLAEIRNLSPESKEAQMEIKKWWDYVNNIGTYSLDAFKGLGEMYVTDERFTKNIDQYGEGLAQFMCDAMRIFAEKNK